MNDEIIKNRWNLTRQELKRFQNWYKKQNKKTQDKIQEIINNYDISFEELSKPISKSEKERLERKIQSWIEQGLFVGYFQYRVLELFSKSMTYRDLLEILIYGAFIEEEETVFDDIKTVFSTVALDCYNQGLTDLKKEKVKKVPNSLDKVIYETLIDGIVFEDYFKALYLTNAQEIQKLVYTSLLQGNKLEISNGFVQRQFEKQRNKLVSTTDDKFSGGLDKYVTSIGNMAYIEASGENDTKVKFISDHCEHVTEMCEYMDGMVFHSRGRNVFKRPMGKTQKDLVIQDVDVMGLVIGINQPPISEHFHWCHSTLTYQTDKSADELRKIIFETDSNYNGLYLYEVELESNSNKNIAELVSNVRKITSENFQNKTKGVKIIRSKENLSYFDTEENVINLKNNADEYGLIHELAHKFQQNFTKKEQEEYIQIITNKFSGYTKRDFIEIKSSAGGKYYVLKDYSKFVSKYQTRIYDGGFDLFGNLDLEYAQEYFSEGVKYYYKKPELLENKDKALYTFVRKVIDKK